MDHKTRHESKSARVEDGWEEKKEREEKLSKKEIDSREGDFYGREKKVSSSV